MEPWEATDEVQEDAQPLQHPSGQIEELPLDITLQPEALVDPQTSDCREPPSDGQPSEAPSDQKRRPRMTSRSRTVLVPGHASDRDEQTHSVRNFQRDIGCSLQKTAGSLTKTYRTSGRRAGNDCRLMRRRNRLKGSPNTTRISWASTTNRPSRITETIPRVIMVHFQAKGILLRDKRALSG